MLLPSVAQRLPDPDSLVRVLSRASADGDKLRTLLVAAEAIEHYRPEQARNYAIEAIALAQKLARPVLVAQAKELVGGASTVIGDTTRGMMELEAALTMRKAQGDEQATAHCWWRLGYAFRKCRRMQQAANAFMQCIAIGRKLKAAEACAEGLYALSDLRQDEGTLEEMMNLALEADSVYRPKVPTLTRARALSYLGNAYLSRGELDSAFAVHQRAKAMCQAIGSTYWAAWNDQQIGYVYSDRGDYAKAGEHGQMAINALEKLGAVRDMPQLLYFLGYTYWQVLPDSVVHGFYARALHLADSLGMLRQRTLINLNIGKLFIGCDSASCKSIGIPFTARFDSAQTRLQQALGVAEQMKHPAMIGMALNTMGMLENYRGDFNAALGYHTRYLELQETLGDQNAIARGLMAIGNDHMQLGAYARAIPSLEKALSVCVANGLTEIKLYVLRDLYDAYKRSGSTAKALMYLEQWKALNDSISNDGLAAKLTEQKLTYDFEKRQFTDSLAHAQALVLEKQASAATLERQRSRTRFFVIGGLVLVAGLTGAFVLDRRRRKERFQRKALQLEMQTLRSQMDPHFLFNALASINGFIGREDVQVTKDFVARFAKLTRMVLENSRHTEVPLEKDLQALELYLQLEQTRSGNKFDYRIEVDAALDKQDVRLPPLVLQPFVENAIWHGVANLEGRGTIVVRISEKSEELLLDVEDDGVGIQQDKSPVAQDGKTSLGTSITRSRLDLIEKLKGRPAGYHYLERTQGTHVRITLPI